MKLRYLGDADGLTKDSEYEVVGFGDSIVVIVDDEGQMQRLTYGKINDRSLWDPPGSGKKSAKDKKSSNEDDV